MKKNNGIQSGAAAGPAIYRLIFVMVVSLSLAVGCGSTVSEQPDMNSITSRLKRLETRIAAIEMNNDANSDRYEQIEKLMGDIERRQADLILSIGKLEKKLQSDMFKAVGQSHAGAETAADESRTTGTAAKKAGTKVQYHEVRKGDTVFSICHQYDLTPETLKKMNDLESNVIKPGQKLRVQ